MTEEQKTRAAEAMFDAWPNNAWPRDSNDAYGDMSPKAKSYLVAVVEAVAPLVQEPWEPAFVAEGAQLVRDLDKSLVYSVALSKFVERRNSALLPKVDPVARIKDDIQRQLRVRVEPNQMVPNIHLTHEDAQAILAALDREAK